MEVELVRLEPAILAHFELEAGQAEARGGSGYFALLEPAGQVAALPPSALAHVAPSPWRPGPRACWRWPPAPDPRTSW